MNANHFQNTGLTNKDTEYYGAIAMANKPNEKYLYTHTCTSHKCCTFLVKEQKEWIKKSNEWQMVKKFETKKKVIKFSSFKIIKECQDCKNPLVIT